MLYRGGPNWLKAWALRLTKLRGKKRATVALARRIGVVLHRMWRDGTEFRFTRKEPIHSVAFLSRRAPHDRAFQYGGARDVVRGGADNAGLAGAGRAVRITARARVPAALVARLPVHCMDARDDAGHRDGGRVAGGRVARFCCNRRLCYRAHRAGLERSVVDRLSGMTLRWPSRLRRYDTIIKGVSTGIDGGVQLL